MQPYFSATNGLIVSEDDVRRLFLRHPKTNTDKHKISRVFRILIILPLLIVLAYLALNAPAVYIKTKFTLQTASPSQSIGIAPSIPTPNQAPIAITEPKIDQLKIIDNHLEIERINVNTPINWGVDGTNVDAILQSLQTGVSQLKESVLPNQAGNVFIVGHSSNYLWAKGNYKYVFALLPQLVIGDRITLTYQNQLFEYRVSNIQTVKPNDMTVINGDGKTHLTLMTCVPLGTSLRRLVVVADPINNLTEAPPTKIPAPRFQMSLPAIR